jgi:hypothetical protein
MWIVKIRSFFSDKCKWVEATELGSHPTKKTAEQAAKDGLTASYRWRADRASAASGAGA